VKTGCRAPSIRRVILFENLRKDWHTLGRSLSRQGFWVMAVNRFGLVVLNSTLRPTQ
jgi:hypothetical protein